MSRTDIEKSAIVAGKPSYGNSARHGNRTLIGFADQADVM
jgi:hypothetical protein